MHILCVTILETRPEIVFPTFVRAPPFDKYRCKQLQLTICETIQEQEEQKQGMSISTTAVTPAEYVASKCISAFYIEEDGSMDTRADCQPTMVEWDAPSVKKCDGRVPSIAEQCAEPMSLYNAANSGITLEHAADDVYGWLKTNGVLITRTCTYKNWIFVHRPVKTPGKNQTERSAHLDNKYNGVVVNPETGDLHFVREDTTHDKDAPKAIRGTSAEIGRVHALTPEMAKASFAFALRSDFDAQLRADLIEGRRNVRTHAFTLPCYEFGVSIQMHMPIVPLTPNFKILLREAQKASSGTAAAPAAAVEDVQKLPTTAPELAKVSAKPSPAALASAKRVAKAGLDEDAAAAQPQVKATTPPKKRKAPTAAVVATTTTTSSKKARKDTSKETAVDIGYGIGNTADTPLTYESMMSLMRRRYADLADSPKPNILETNAYTIGNACDNSNRVVYACVNSLFLALCAYNPQMLAPIETIAECTTTGDIDYDDPAIAALLQ